MAKQHKEFNLNNKEHLNNIPDTKKSINTKNYVKNNANPIHLNQFITYKSKNNNGIFIRIITIIRKTFSDKVSFNKDNTKKNKMYQKCSINIPKNKFEFLNMDRSTLGKETIELIKFFKNGTKNLETYKSGESFKNDEPILKKLSRYETFINFLIEHNIDEKLPQGKFINKYCMYKNELIYSTSIIKRHKLEALEKGDLIKNDEGRYILSRKEKY
jgi:hypothetical protein